MYIYIYIYIYVYIYIYTYVYIYIYIYICIYIYIYTHTFLYAHFLIIVFYNRVKLSFKMPTKQIDTLTSCNEKSCEVSCAIVTIHCLSSQHSLNHHSNNCFLLI